MKNLNTVPTAEEFLKQSKNLDYSTLIWNNIYPNVLPFIEADLIEFAKLHVEAALKAASENAETKPVIFTNDEEIDKDSILNAYPLTNIK